MAEFNSCSFFVESLASNDVQVFERHITSYYKLSCHRKHLLLPTFDITSAATSNSIGYVPSADVTRSSTADADVASDIPEKNFSSFVFLFMTHIFGPLPHFDLLYLYFDVKDHEENM